VKDHAPYLEADWRADRERVAQGEPLTCPDCDFSDNPLLYGPRGGEEGKGPPRRACKVCGFWQDADGSSAYRCWKSTHRCDPGLNGPYDCEHCGQTGLTGSHDCGNYLKPREDGYECGTCGRWHGRETPTPWDRKGSG